MTIAEVLVTLGGAVLIVAILWYFFWSESEPVQPTATEREMEE